MPERTVCVSKDAVLNILDAELNALYSEELAAPELNSHSFEAVASVKRIMDSVKELPTYVTSMKLPPMSEEEKTKMQMKMWRDQRSIYESKVAESLARIELIDKRLEMIEKREKQNENKD